MHSIKLISTLAKAMLSPTIIDTLLPNLRTLETSTIDQTSWKIARSRIAKKKRTTNMKRKTMKMIMMMKTKKRNMNKMKMTQRTSVLNLIRTQRT